MMKKHLLTAVTLAMLLLMITPAYAGTWRQEHSVWSYYDRDGSRMTGWVKDQGTWYYIRENGEMATGWLEYGDDWYYLESTGAMVVDWKKIDGNWYYFHGNGAMAYHTWIENYYVNDNGQWVKTK